MNQTHVKKKSNPCEKKLNLANATDQTQQLIKQIYPDQPIKSINRSNPTNATDQTQQLIKQIYPLPINPSNPPPINPSTTTEGTRSSHRQTDVGLARGFL